MGFLGNTDPWQVKVLETDFHTEELMIVAALFQVKPTQLQVRRRQEVTEKARNICKALTNTQNPTLFQYFMGI